MEKPKFPIRPEDTGQKVDIEENYRYMIAAGGIVVRFPTYKIWTPEQKAAVKKYNKQLKEYNNYKMSSKVNSAMRRKGIEQKKKMRAEIKERNKQLKEEAKAKKIEEEKEIMQKYSGTF